MNTYVSLNGKSIIVPSTAVITNNSYLLKAVVCSLCNAKPMKNCYNLSNNKQYPDHIHHTPRLYLLRDTLEKRGVNLLPVYDDFQFIIGWINMSVIGMGVSK